ncbi:MAG: hypothetical protein RLZZ502_186 [Pseudomonadota bacterium]
MMLFRSQLFFCLSGLAFCHTALAQSSAVVKIDGSSTAFPIAEALAEEFQKLNKNVRVTVGISGTGGGFKKFCRGDTEVSNASRPILKSEMDACKNAGIHFYELPIAYDALTVVVNPKNPIKELSIEQLRKLWSPSAQGVVTQWQQVDAKLPAQAFKLYGPGADSGTFDYFTEAVNGKAKASRGDFSASEDDNVLVQGVSRDVNALGYFGYAYYVENKTKLKAVAIVNKKGQAVLPSEQSVVDGSYSPLSRPVFVYVSEKAYQSRPEVRAYVDFMLKNVGRLAKEVRSIPLPPKAYELITANLKKGKLGSVFNGTPETGLTIEELLAREAK